MGERGNHFIPASRTFPSRGSPYPIRFPKAFPLRGRCLSSQTGADEVFSMRSKRFLFPSHQSLQRLWFLDLKDDRLHRLRRSWDSTVCALSHAHAPGVCGHDSIILQAPKKRQHPMGAVSFLVDLKGIEPSNLTDANRALSQLSYKPIFFSALSQEPYVLYHRFSICKEKY